jgi:hypothetical protein
MWSEEAKGGWMSGPIQDEKTIDDEETLDGITPLGTIEERLRQCGISRRSFLVFCTSLMVAASSKHEPGS